MGAFVRSSLKVVEDLIGALTVPMLKPLEGSKVRHCLWHLLLFLNYNGNFV